MINYTLRYTDIAEQRHQHGDLSRIWCLCTAAEGDSWELEKERGEEGNKDADEERRWWKTTAAEALGSLGCFELFSMPVGFSVTRLSRRAVDKNRPQTKWVNLQDEVRMIFVIVKELQFSVTWWHFSVFWNLEHSSRNSKCCS